MDRKTKFIIFISLIQSNKAVRNQVWTNEAIIRHAIKIPEANIETACVRLMNELSEGSNGEDDVLWAMAKEEVDTWQHQPQNNKLAKLRHSSWLKAKADAAKAKTEARAEKEKASPPAGPTLTKSGRVKQGNVIQLFRN